MSKTDILQEVLDLNMQIHGLYKLQSERITLLQERLERLEAKVKQLESNALGLLHVRT